MNFYVLVNQITHYLENFMTCINHFFHITKNKKNNSCQSIQIINKPLYIWKEIIKKNLLYDFSKIINLKVRAKPLLTITIILLFTSLVHATQNQIWSVPPNYLKFTSQIPIPTVIPLPTQQTSVGQTLANYNGQPSNFTHNAMQDTNGDLLFFIVDGIIYDKDGYVINQITDSYGTFKGYVETLIIPVPGNCQQYYLISSSAGFGPSGHTSIDVRYALLDLSIESITTGRQGVLIDPIQPNYLPGNQAFDGFDNTFPLSSLVTRFEVFGDPEAKTSMAVSKLRPDNTRLLFIMGEFEFFRFKVSSTGIVYDNYSSSLDLSSVLERNFRSEMEIIDIPNGYRLAFGYPSNDGMKIFKADFTQAGIISPSTIDRIKIAWPSTVSSSAGIKGLEFSPNGNYLYITDGSITPSSGAPFKIYDIVNKIFLTFNIIHILNTPLNEYANSQIERGLNGKLYLSNGVNLATIDHINNPNGSNGLIWTSSAIPLPYNLNNFGYASQGNSYSKIYAFPDQIDGEDYKEHIFAITECCINNTNYDVEENNDTYTGFQQWEPSSNPFNSSSTVTVKNKLVIKTGANISIKDMRFEFAPNAQVIVENGARLTINKTVFTSSNSCGTDKMWQGVEVWGQPGFQPAVAGIFKARNESLLENAREATANSKHKLDSIGNPINRTYNQSFNGGIINILNSTFLNNANDATFEPYTALLPNSNTTIDDRSVFVDCRFITDAPLNDPRITWSINHVLMKNVSGIRFVGCDFENLLTALNTPFSYVNRPKGIFSIYSDFRVQSHCSSQNCTTVKKSKFENLSHGIRAFGKPQKSAIITDSEFIDNWKAITLGSMDNSNISDNSFDIGKNSQGSGAINRSYGLTIYNSDKYKIENNGFNTTHGGYLGINIRQSGVGANEIYRNTFNNLTIGTQINAINGDGLITGNGLELRCNRYYDTTDYDIYIPSGVIKAEQGSCQTPANNLFSHTSTNGDFWNGGPLASPVVYNYSSVSGNPSPELIPRSGSFTTGVSPTPCQFSTFDFNKSCPIR